MEWIYVIDWQAPIIGDNVIVTPGGLFPSGSKVAGEFVIVAQCAGDDCTYATELADGTILEFTQTGRTIFGTANVSDEFCNRDIFLTFKVSDFQVINNRLVPDRAFGGRVEEGTCETAVYREITYSGGYEFIGSFAD